MSNIGYVLAGVSWLVITTLVVSSAPGLVEELSQGYINTTSIQESYNTTGLEAQPNVTTGPKVVDQATALADTLGNPTGENKIISSINLIILAGLIAWIVSEVWLG